jgi:hypothetical protein
VSVSWQAVSGATSYVVVRWLVGDNVCCGNTSPLEGIPALTWQDDVLPRAGTYGYRVYANNSNVISTGESTLTYSPPLPAGPKPTSGTKFATRVPPRTLDLSGFVAVGPSSPVPARALKLEGFSIAGTQPIPPRSITIAGFTGVSVEPIKLPVKGTTYLPSRSISTPGFAATGAEFRVLPRTLVTAGLTAIGPAALIPPRTIKLGGFTATSP